jgi:4a-hydroxytetrahydrobiopterin dehydratase
MVKMMAQLLRERCVACRSDSPRVRDEDLGGLKAEIPDWELVAEDGIRKLVRAFRFPDFARALAFANAVAQLAEADGHHPRIVVEWGRVAIAWWTHKIRDLHRNDFIMAAKTDATYESERAGGRC